MAQEFVWRKKELHALKSMVIASRGTHASQLHVRAAIPLLYAHWEGFVKQISGYYLEFVARSKIKHRNLPPHFLARVVRRIIHDAISTSKTKACIDVVRFFRESMDSTSDINFRTGIATKANLNSDVLKDIVLALGLDYSLFATKEKLIDEKLLANRNNIAHGERCLVDADEYLSTHDGMLTVMQTFYDEIENSVLLERYRIS